MLKKFYESFKEAFTSVIPIYLLIMVLNFTPFLNLSGREIMVFSITAAMLIIGMALFNLGANVAMTPMGKAIGVGLTKQGKLSILLIVSFIFGLLITVAEPDLTVLANQVSAVMNPWVLIICIGLGVGIFLSLAAAKIIFKINLTTILTYFYMILFAASIMVILTGNGDLLALSFDSGGVTTGPVTVPFIMALGVGISSVVSKKSEKDASFGLIALCSVGPILAVLVLGIFAKGTLSYELPDYSIGSNFAVSILEHIWTCMKEVGLALGLIVVFFAVCNVIFLKISKKKLIQLGIGLLYAYVGLVLFLAAASTGFLPIGYKIGSSIADYSKYLLIPVGFVMGALTVLAEPAVHVLNQQVEEITQGLVKKKSMLMALTIAVGISLSLSMIRIIFGFSIMYYLIPGYLICLGLSFFVPKIYTAIAFDSGGVASGPLTSSFILPMGVGACYILNGTTSVFTDAFGLVAMVAMTPLITIELLGLAAIIKDKRRVKKQVKQMIASDDEVIIKFM